MSFKLALCSEVFKTPIVDTIQTVAELGFDGIEIAPFTVAESVDDVSAEERKAIRGCAADCGIDIVGLHWLLVSPKGLHLTTDDDAVRSRTVDYLRSLTDFCADLGGRVMILGSPAQRNIPEGGDPVGVRARAVDSLRQLGDTLAARGVHLLVEALHPNETNFIQTIEDALSIGRDVHHPNVGYMLDCKAMSGMPDGIIGTIDKHGAGTGYFHANEPSGVGPGMGEMDFTPVLSALKASGYRGWVSSEPFDYSPDPETVARTALTTLQQAMNASD